jgi:multidrug efflux pump subunit AcrB
MILAIVPFGFLGAALGHVVMGLEFTMLSLFGMIALTGVVVNDSIVLIDFINHRLEKGMPLHEALQEAGVRRFRPVILTSVTTVAGLTPLLLETSFQGQVLVPMANSLAFGLMVATAIVLILVPALYCLYFRLTGRSEETTSPPPSTPAFVETYTPVVESLFDAELVASDQVSESA